MASIHLSEIIKILEERGAKDAAPLTGSREGFYLEIQCDLPPMSGAKPDMKQREPISLASYYGFALITFDEYGITKSIIFS